ncbi:tRNA (cytidine(56)-2'-O)-methyltransferase [Halobaculum sp. MBLA0147]|uniref:tRNA (cytidine(56)-2'-O)-methyltransferase n=1 Tax=Halobaculum sp. MBLA0147 TaxID=3079934 RepID=UPI0035264514
MHEDNEVCVVRYGHRPGRDDRMTTHVGLTARALGADRVILPDNAGNAADTVRDITDRFGGPFTVESRTVGPSIARNWEGTVAHLTMYGLPVQEVEQEVREAHAEEPLLVVVGGEKVPFEFYDEAAFNVAVTNQPHSEVAGLAVFLDRLFEGRELDREWTDADRTVVPEATGKRVVDADGDPAHGTGSGEE